ncbi:Ylf2p SCDLUD_004201 [Saccharomycodes ludwigii]|uniref:Ylf2p n=1 Tax=Saccharomycodes ludwigii TaxID=36035 RepID=UPI001E821134|nr:hypothetical protein SCDLUD_004201 [Saccharomycodes ludwigii]KAH3899898.1 hypothetical protein SCDLUD_004201 [Saccharomycodes ludwigii]
MKFSLVLFSTPVKKVLLGRPTNNLTSGIVGLANVGKSTFFQAITQSKLGNPANYPFATIEPEEARVIVPSKRLQHLSNLYQTAKPVPSTLTIYDIAGLTRGASNGEGLGNKFLNDIRHVDGIYQVVRGFMKEDITHIEGSVDPVRDLSVVQDELILKDIEYLERIRERLQKKMNKTAKSCNDYKEMEFEMNLLNSLEEHLYGGQKIYHYKQSNGSAWTEKEVAVLNKHNFLTAKPSVILLNVSPKDYLLQTNQFKDNVYKWIQEFSPGDPLLLFSAEFETKYNELMCTENKAPKQLQEYCREIVDGEAIVKDIKSALPEIITLMREKLGLISFFTCGPLECRQWSIRKGATAPNAAGIIHTSLEQTFISAEIIKYSDLAALSPPFQESFLKNNGKIKRAGKNYIMEDGDVALFKAAKGNAR